MRRSRSHDALERARRVAHASAGADLGSTAPDERTKMQHKIQRHAERTQRQVNITSVQQNATRHAE
jgi:hypothetical protein